MDGTTVALRQLSAAVWLVLVAGLSLAGCVKNLEQNERRLTVVTSDCVVPKPPSITTWGAPISVAYPQVSLWIWDSVTISGGETRRNVAATVTSVSDACSVGPTLLRDAAGGPLELLALTDAEQQHDRDRADGRHAALAVTGGFVHQGRAFLFYEKRVLGPGLFDVETIGMGLCVIDAAGEACQRQRPNRFADEPTLLWLGRRTWNRGVMVDEGYATVVGCYHVAAFEDLCSVGRVPLDQVADAERYQVRGFDDWIVDRWNAAAVLKTAGQVTPGYNPFLKRYTAVVSDIWGSRIRLYLGDSPWQLEGSPTTLVDAVPPSAQWFIGGGIEHPALASENGRSIAVSYYTDGAAAPGLHLLTLRFHAELGR